MTDPLDRQSIRVALVGCGTVGSAVARRLTGSDGPRGLELTHVFDRRPALKGRDWPPHLTWTSNIGDIFQSDIDVIVEALRGVEPAAGWIRAALLAGKSVVTANKQVMAAHGGDLWSLAARQGRQLRFEAAVGGAMPIVRAVADGLAGDRITRIAAILNGTTNAVLSRMEETGCSLVEALDEARARGYAERDPTADLDGTDARAKLAILCALAFGLRVDHARIASRSAAAIGAREIDAARRGNGVVRQVAFAEYDRRSDALAAWVAPVVVPADSLFARTVGAQNAALICGEHAGEIGIFGAGAGGEATAVAVLSDLLAVARDRAAIVPPPRLTSPRALGGFSPDAAFAEVLFPAEVV